MVFVVVVVVVVIVDVVDVVVVDVVDGAAVVDANVGGKKLWRWSVVGGRRSAIIYFNFFIFLMNHF